MSVNVCPARLPRVICSVLVAAVIAGAAGCAGVPSQEMSDARRAVDAARDARAAQHAPSSMARASAALDEATVALGAGDYERARRLAGAARDEAIASRQLAARVAEAQAEIASARAAGRPWEGAASLLRAAEDASRDGDSARAVDMAERALQLVR